MSKTEKTFVILTPGFPQDEGDSTCLPMQQTLVRALKRIYPFINIIILTFQYPYIKKRYKWHDTTVISFNGRNKGGISRLLLRQELYRTLREINKSKKISGLLSFWYGECAAVGNNFAEKYGLKHFCWILGQDARKENNYPAQLKLKPAKLIAISDFIGEHFETNHKVHPLHVIPPGIEPLEYIGLPLKKDIDLLGVGSLIPLKQYNLFIEVADELKKKFPNLKAMLVGKGPEQSSLADKIQTVGLEKNITLTGELSYREVLKLMQRTKIFLHPSSYEGFSGACLEALYGAAHVISFCKPMNQFIQQWHVTQSKNEMIEKVIEILDDPPVIYRSTTFSTMEDVAKKMMSLFGITNSVVLEKN